MAKNWITCTFELLFVQRASETTTATLLDPSLSQFYQGRFGTKRASELRTARFGVVGGTEKGDLEKTERTVAFEFGYQVHMGHPS